MNFCFRLVCLFTTLLMATHALSQDLSGWSDKTVCRQLLNNPDNTDYVQEADSRSLACGSSTQSSNEIVDLKKANGGSKVPSSNVKASNAKYKKILSGKSKNYNKEFCVYEDKWPLTKIENLLNQKKYGLEIIEAGALGLDNIVENLIPNLDMYVTEFISNPTENNAREVKEIYNLLFSKKAYSKLKTNTFTNALPLKDFLITAMYAYKALDNNGFFNASERKSFLNEIQKRFDIIKLATKWGFTMQQCRVGQDIFGCQNHTMAQQLIRTLYGAIFDSPDDYAMGEKMYKFAIDDLKPDGALWREAARGRWSWNYYSHTLGLLISMGEIYKHNGEDLYSYKSNINGLTIHDAVAFLLSAIQDNEKMWKYAKQLKGVDGRRDHTDYKSLEYLNRLITDTEKSGAKNWFYIYRTNFPDHKNTKLAETLIPTFRQQLQHSDHIGILAQCIYVDEKAIKVVKDEYKGNLETKANQTKDFYLVDGSMLLKSFDADIKIYENRFKLMHQSEDEIQFGGDLSYKTKDNSFFEYADLMFEKEFGEITEIKLSWIVEGSNEQPFSSFSKAFEIANGQCGAFSDMASDSLVIIIKTQSVDQIDRYNCQQKQFKAHLSPAEFDKFRDLIESSVKLMKNIPLVNEFVQNL